MLSLSYLQFLNKKNDEIYLKRNSRVKVITMFLVNDPRGAVDNLDHDFEVAAAHAGHGGVKLKFTLVSGAEEFGAGEVHHSLTGGMCLRDQHKQEVPWKILRRTHYLSVFAFS